MAIVQALIASLLFALGGGGVLLGLPLLLGRRAERYPHWLIPLALALGFALGFGRLFEQWAPPFPPVDSTQWIFYLLPLAAIWGSVQTRKAFPKGLQIGMRFILSGLGQFLVLSPLRESAGGQSWVLWALALTLVSTLLWTGLDKQAQSPQPAWQILTGSGVAAALGALLMLGHSVVLSQQALILAGLLALVFFLSWLLKPENAQGFWAVPVLGFSLLASSGHFFADLSPAVFLLAPALLMPLLSQTPFLQNKPLWLKQGVPLMLSVLICALAVGGVYLSQPPDTSGGYY